LIPTAPYASTHRFRTTSVRRSYCRRNRRRTD